MQCKLHGIGRKSETNSSIFEYVKRILETSEKVHEALYGDFKQNPDRVCEANSIRLKPSGFKTICPDDNRELVPPDPMSNSEVKRLIADGSVGFPHVRVGHRQAFIQKCLSSLDWGIFLPETSVMIQDPLNLEQLEAAFPELAVKLFESVPSTNTHVMESVERAADKLVLAEGQSGGKGRRSKVWLSPLGRSLSMTLALATNRELAEVGGLSSIVGIALCQQLREMGVDQAALKWPNDVLVEDRKLCGILVELRKSDDAFDVVIGVGVNVELNDEEINQIEQPVTDLRRCGVTLSRTELVIRLVKAMQALIISFEREGFGQFVPIFDDLHILHDKPCWILLGENRVEGVVRGISVNGALAVETAKGLEEFHGGEVSLRAGSVS